MPIARISRMSRALVLAAVLLCACVQVNHVRTTPLDPSAMPVRVRSPVKAHLVGGSTVVYPTGVAVAGDTLRGVGRRYDLRLALVGMVGDIPLDSVVGLESYRTGVNAPATVLLSVPGTALGVVASAGLLVALFGSCPTFYADSAGQFALEAEGFSYSIAPLFEARDVDVLRSRPDSTGRVRIEVRNEALETHYLNHLELLEVRHTPAERIVPDVQGQPLAIRDLHAPATARDRAGRDLRAVLAAAEGRIFQTDSMVLAHASLGDFTDHIDVSLPAPAGVDSVAVALRLRNSLLTTVLLYDVMLGSPGARSLDWLGSDLETVGRALELGRWYVERMGLRIAVWEDGAYREVARIGDSGPIAWKDIAAVVPVPPGDSLRLRLSFVADQWRIDRVAIAAGVRRPETRSIPAALVLGADGAPDDRVLTAVRTPDETYLQTSPGQRLSLHFDVGPGTEGEMRSYLLGSQGYYTEWIRQDWIRNPERTSPFVPSDAALITALDRWRARQSELERDFYATRIPVR